MYVMNFNRYLLDYDKTVNQTSEKLIDSEVITDSETIINNLLDMALCGIECVDYTNDIDLKYELYHYYAKESLNMKELSYDNCIWFYMKEDNNIYKCVYSFTYDDEGE